LQKIVFHSELTDSLEILRFFGFKVLLLLALASGKDIGQSFNGIFFPFTNDAWMNIIHFGELRQRIAFTWRSKSNLILEILLNTIYAFGSILPADFQEESHLKARAISVQKSPRTLARQRTKSQALPEQFGIVRETAQNTCNQKFSPTRQEDILIGCVESPA